MNSWSANVNETPKAERIKPLLLKHEAIVEEIVNLDKVSWIEGCAWSNWSQFRQFFPLNTHRLFNRLKLAHLINFTDYQERSMIWKITVNYFYCPSNHPVYEQPRTKQTWQIIKIIPRTNSKFCLISDLQGACYSQLIFNCNGHNFRSIRRGSFSWYWSLSQSNICRLFMLH